MDRFGVYYFANYDGVNYLSRCLACYPMKAWHAAHTIVLKSAINRGRCGAELMSKRNLLTWTILWSPP